MLLLAPCQAGRQGKGTLDIVSGLAVFTIEAKQDSQCGIRERESFVELDRAPKAHVGVRIQGQETVDPSTYSSAAVAECVERCNPYRSRRPVASTITRIPRVSSQGSIDLLP